MQRVGSGITSTFNNFRHSVASCVVCVTARFQWPILRLVLVSIVCLTLLSLSVSQTQVLQDPFSASTGKQDPDLINLPADLETSPAVSPSPSIEAKVVPGQASGEQGPRIQSNSEENTYGFFLKTAIGVTGVMSAAGIGAYCRKRRRDSSPAYQVSWPIVQVVPVCVFEAMGIDHELHCKTVFITCRPQTTQTSPRVGLATESGVSRTHVRWRLKIQIDPDLVGHPRQYQRKHARQPQGLPQIGHVTNLIFSGLDTYPPLSHLSMSVSCKHYITGVCVLGGVVVVVDFGDFRNSKLKQQRPLEISIA